MCNVTLVTTFATAIGLAFLAIARTGRPSSYLTPAVAGTSPVTHQRNTFTLMLSLSLSECGECIAELRGRPHGRFFELESSTDRAMLADAVGVSIDAVSRGVNCSCEFALWRDVLGTYNTPHILYGSCGRCKFLHSSPARSPAFAAL